ncbi:ABR080Wp [Eremothecium gossypii ATCC 10895]|uniref:ABR080Wp n=1 Tax=Eremothecium gossypii (strain ATCC 10895 / CBS 109.51 / FGSC 9923 / NRRL Y-1056) TaxID=284811 RepID=Q75DE7_EREGS|nr:ABR080Wp [Eremothecium gossypii ATCC 10895]AAS50850.2 ABR080Wp [Eremothecium gossypii ATCC 10895]AEY95139.1 FABR080Wp [Eremothecium gossypii FDAG1]
MGFPPPGNYFFLVPWIAVIPWCGMLIAMLVCWSVQGHPIYWFMDGDQFPVYISDIGATNLQPLFVTCVAWQGLWYCIMVACEFFQRSGHWPLPWLARQRLPADVEPVSSSSYMGSELSMRVRYAELLSSSRFLMPPYYTKHERNLIFASFVLGLIGELAILMCAIFSTAKFHKVHLSMVGVFVSMMYFSILCAAIEYLSMGRHYARLHPLAGSAAHVGSASSRHGHVWNKLTVSGTVKMVWLFLAAAWAICFGAVKNPSISASFEWVLAFWLCAYYVIVSVDFYMGSRYKESKYFHQITNFSGYYKYDQLVLGEAKLHVERVGHDAGQDYRGNTPVDIVT